MWHGHQATTLSKHDAIEVAIRYDRLEESEYVAVLDHKHKPETAKVQGPSFQNERQNQILKAEMERLWGNFGLSKCKEISERAGSIELQRQSDALFKWWITLATEEIEANTGQTFDQTNKPGQASEPTLVARKDIAKRCKAAGKESHLGELMVLKRALQELRAHLWQQKGPNTAGLARNISRAFNKARRTAPAEEKDDLDWLRSMYQNEDLVNTYQAIDDLDKIIKKHSTILWIARRQEWEEQISGSIQKGSGLVHRAIKEQIAG